MSKVILQDIGSGYNLQTVVNNNNDFIEEAFSNTLSRDGSTPNGMLVPLDMNSKPVINVGSPVNSTSAARWVDVTDLVDVTNIAAPAMTGNEDKALFTDGSVAVWRETPYIGQTPAEASLAITAISTSKIEGNVLRYGATGDGVTSDATAIQNAINVKAVDGGIVEMPTPVGGKYFIGATQITIPANVVLRGDACETGAVEYTGAGTAFVISGFGSGIENMYITTTNPAASGISMGNDSRRNILRRVTVQNTGTAASRTGTGLVLSTTNAATTFSGNLLMEQLYLLGYKYGIDANCFELGFKTWTTVIGSQVFIIGPGAGVVAGSRGIRFDSTTNGVGSVIFGGTIEGFEAPIEIADGGFGISCYVDIEGNTSNEPLLGASWNGEIVAHPAGTTYRGGANGSSNRWFMERHLNGVWDREAYYSHIFNLYDGSAALGTVDITRGDSRIAGGTPTRKFRFACGNSGADSAPDRNYLEMPSGVKWASGSGSPEGAVTGTVGSLYTRTDGGAGTTLYVKETGSGNTGWAAK